MPSTIFLSKQQIAVIAELNADVVVNETHLISDCLDFWVMGPDSHGTQHRSIIIEQDGTVVSDAVVSDQVGTWHGTTTGYVNHKCRCRDCKGAWNEYHAAYRVNRFKGKGAKCLVKGCTRKAWPSAGNGLCQPHHDRKMVLKKKIAAKKRREQKRRKERAAART
jgi:hypothetical protein